MATKKLGKAKPGMVGGSIGMPSGMSSKSKPAAKRKIKRYKRAV